MKLIPLPMLPLLPPLTLVPPELIAGRYGLVRKLAVGGMAEVWLARQRGLEGFEKLVVVKRILPHLANNPEFVQMFLDEARTAADLRHSNVASVTDVGTESGAYFIAMEYLHGQDLTHVVHRCKVRGERIPLPHLLQIVSEAAQGLDYAHRKVDRHGEAQQIIHRDVSPQNVLVTYEGATKLLDFGIASASHRTTHTNAGVVKGKFAYMSPEQFDGAPLDARSDLFSLGVVLWELVTLQRLFWRTSDAETLRAVMECRIPRPSSLETDCPQDLEDLILKALARRPSQRFASCADFAEALDFLLDKQRLPHSPARVGAWLRGIFPENTLDPTEVPIAPAPPPEAQTRNEKFPAPRLQGSKTDLVPSTEGLASVHRFPTGESVLAPSENLVPAEGAFLGRTAELEQLTAHFNQGARLVTVVGAAGQGKSRLVARFAERHAAQWKGKVWTVELSDARSLEQLVQQVMISCGLEQDGVCETQPQLTADAGRMMAALGPALLILNDVGVSPDPIAQWLAGAPQLSILATGSEPLAIPSEQVLRLSGLDDSTALRLFVSQLERSGVSSPSADSERAKRVKTCRLLEGCPLAIELVGAIPQPIEAGVGATLVGVIASSWTLLSQAERQVLSQLSVFRGGFTIEMAERVVKFKGGEDIPSVLESLLRKSLLRVCAATEAATCLRYRMPQCIHDYAAKVLEASGLAHTTRADHAEWFLSSSEHRTHLPVERDNLLEIFARAQATSPVTVDSSTSGLRALHGLDPFLTRLAPCGPHLSVLDAAISQALAIGAPKALVARAMQDRANVHRHRGQSELAMRGLATALEVVRETDDRALECRILCDWASTCFVCGDVDGAIVGLEKSLAIARAVGDDATEVKALSLKAMAYVARRDLGQALACCDKALPLARSRGDAVSEARVLGTVGSLFLEEGRTELARAFFCDAIARCEQENEPALKGYFLGKLAQVLAERGELEEARAKVAAALEVLHRAGDVRHEGLFLSFSASLEALGGHPHKAGLSLKAAEAKLRTANDPLLLTVLALRTMELRLMDREASNEDARALLQDRLPDAAQSDEVRLAALHLERIILKS